ncbi:N-acetylmuramic acid 6-phosphate etherase [Egicoccus halophilus]|uniref:N-acetylmuramic acid 6-phosphate etherase n=1 Tax=Egicoccus halophilus TaxID=1670830 RepID=A0A8J3EUU9_9ACTN|nr:N-acetylmuramic acid 6-phosphate etherase [Egicoccus halophilus]GGI08416.1 N-acetylmuramic acid 6-phosphate etherase [Egicoccus halophilus]
MADRLTLDHLATEGRLPAARDLDLRTTAEQVALFAAQDARAVAAVAAAGNAIAAAVDLAVARMRRGGRLVYVGAGTPGRLAVTDAAECRPTFGLPDGRVVAVMAGGDDAMSRAAERGEDDAEAARRDLGAVAPGPDDVVVGISASGRTPYVLAALAAARAAGAATVAVVNNPGSVIAEAADVAVVADTGPEIVAGSTRLKAGTAQKLVLNTLSTLTMVQLGRTYGDLMVDVQATNAKLVARARGIVVAATGVDDDTAESALVAADGRAKVAIVALLAGVDADEAARRLAAADGHVRAAAGS